MNPVLVLTRLYITESMRRQLHLITLFLAVMILVLPTLFNAFGMTGFDRVTKDVGLTLLGLYAVGMALFLGSTALPGDIEQRTLHPLLARPISRMQYLLGKFLGYLVVMGASMAVLGLALLTALAVLGTHADPAVLIPVSFYVLEAGILGAFCLFASTFCSPALAGVLGCFLYIVGGIPQTFITFFLSSGGTQVQGALVRAIRLIMPHFDVLHLKDPIVHGETIPGGYLLAAFAYGLVWMVLFLLLADWSFERRDL
ncbi:MAG: ABC transporter permease [Candidatus Xenobium sp.]|jgi:Cu-processing system permease protein|nr:ABC transporter permease subunit [Burkholderiales bacterium]